MKIIFFFIYNFGRLILLLSSSISIQMNRPCIDPEGGGGKGPEGEQVYEPPPGKSRNHRVPSSAHQRNAIKNGVSLAGDGVCLGYWYEPPLSSVEYDD